MSTHTFLQKQGITSISPNYSRLERIKKEFDEKYHTDIPIESVDLPVPMIIGSDERWDFVETLIQNGEIVSETAIFEGEGELVLIRQQKYYRRFSEELRRNKELYKELSDFRSTWNIPSEGEQESFFYEVSCGGNDLYLPGIIQDKTLKDGIRYFCNELRLRVKCPEEFGIVASYILFGDFMDRDDLSFFAIQTTRLFKVPKDDGYSLFLEMKPTLIWDRWTELYTQTRLKQKGKGFIPGEGKVVAFLSANGAPEEFTQSLVFSVPSGKWRNEFGKIRKLLDDEYGENYFIREEPLSPVTLFVIDELASALAKNEKIDINLFKPISIEVMEKFGCTYSDESVKQVWYRYPKEIGERLTLMCPEGKVNRSYTGLSRLKQTP